jgi:soluble lytic murein transglycosylase-like protein
MDRRYLEMKNKKVIVKVRKKRRLRKRAIFTMMAILLAILVFGSFYVKESLANIEEKNITYNQKKKLEVREKELKKRLDRFVYNPNIPMPKEHQLFLYQKTQERGLDYEKVLAIIATESNFQSNAVSSTDDFGYFQINRMNHEYLAETLNTSNSPLNPYVNIDWGTYMLSTLYDYWKEQGMTGEQLDYYVWSSYNKGIDGLKENGLAIRYISKIQENLNNQSF